MKFITTRAFEIFLILSLILNMALITAWVVSPAGPFLQLQGDVATEPRLDLGITEDQFKELVLLEQEFYSSRQALCQDLQEEREALLSLLETPGATASTVADQRARILEGQGRMLDTAVERLLAEKEVLDDEQQALWFESLRARVRCPDPMNPPPGGATTSPF